MSEIEREGGAEARCALMLRLRYMHSALSHKRVIMQKRLACAAMQAACSSAVLDIAETMSIWPTVRPNLGSLASTLAQPYMLVMFDKSATINSLFQYDVRPVDRMVESICPNRAWRKRQSVQLHVEAEVLSLALGGRSRLLFGSVTRFRRLVLPTRHRPLVI